MRTLLIITFMAMTATASGGPRRSWYYWQGTPPVIVTPGYGYGYGRYPGVRYRKPVQSAPRPSWAKGYKVPSYNGSGRVSYGSGIAEQQYVEPVTILNPFVEQENGTEESQSDKETITRKQDDPEGDWWPIPYK